jgi:hypothetical protein
MKRSVGVGRVRGCSKQMERTDRPSEKSLVESLIEMPNLGEKLVRVHPETTLVEVD